MARFKVTLRKVLDAPSGNPFLRNVSLSPNETITASYREWTFDARSEKHARELYDEAVRTKVPGVMGYSLAGIERGKQSAR